jgi:hypothetical protein
MTGTNEAKVGDLVKSGVAKIAPKVRTINMEAQPNIYGKIMNIQQDIHTVIKSGFNDHFKYKFAKERDVIAEVKPLLGREGIAITHSVLKEEEIEHGTTSTGAKKFLTKLTIKFRLTNVKDVTDFIEADAIGSGQDGEDKGVPKAYTMALKYFLSKMFLIETGDDAENYKKDSKGGKNAPANTEDKFSTAMTMIKGSRNIDGLEEYVENMEKSKNFTAAQKNQLKKAVKNRVDEISSK